MRKSWLPSIGIDEAGRGAWAGPVVAAAVFLQKPIRGARDSKELSAAQRDALYEKIIARCICGVGVVESPDIDRLGILAATNKAMSLALEQVLSKVADMPVLVDGRDAFSFSVPHQSFIKGDTYIQSISCASIIAKVTRDRLMTQYCKEFSVYGFEQHKGYGTKAHQKALAGHGPCSLHRASYAPIKLLIARNTG